MELGEVNIFNLLLHAAGGVAGNGRRGRGGRSRGRRLDRPDFPLLGSPGPARCRRRALGGALSLAGDLSVFAPLAVLPLGAVSSTVGCSFFPATARAAVRSTTLPVEAELSPMPGMIPCSSCPSGEGPPSVSGAGCSAPAGGPAFQAYGPPARTFHPRRGFSFRLPFTFTSFFKA